jgi:hypothetical protein
MRCAGNAVDNEVSGMGWHPQRRLRVCRSEPASRAQRLLNSITLMRRHFAGRRTVWHGLFRHRGLKAGQSVLIHHRAASATSPSSSQGDGARVLTTVATNNVKVRALVRSRRGD